MSGSYLAISYFLWAVVAYWVYQDAQKRNLKAAFAWAILTFFFGVFAVIGYWFWILRPNKRGA